jgi:hypothetical protein
MFVSHLERFDLFVTLVARGFFLGDIFFLGIGIGEEKNQRKEANARDEKKLFFGHKNTSFRG